VTLGLCNITAKLPSEGLCSCPPENRSVDHKGGRGPRLRNPVLTHGSPNFFVRGPHEVLLNSPRAGHLTQCDCFGKYYIPLNTNFS